MADTQIIIDAIDTTGNPVKKTITNVNPYASNEQLASLGSAFNSLTDNVYGKTTKITKVNCDAESGGGKIKPTFELFSNDFVTPLTDNQLNVTKNNNNSFGIKCNSDGTIYVPALGAKINIFWRDPEENGVKGFVVNPGANFEAGDTFEVVIKTEETDTYQAGSVTLTVNVTA